MVRFGTASNSKSFYDQGFKHTWQAPAYLSALGLDAFEFSCGHGVSVKEEGARKIGGEVKAHGIAMSVHAPYYINIADTRPEKFANNLRWLVESAQVCAWMNGDRVVFHPGSGTLPAAMETLFAIRKELNALGLEGVTLCPETMGKKSLLGTVDDVLALCGIADNIIPCIDFGHLHVRDLGAIKGADDYERILKVCEAAGEKMKRVHVHFSHIEFGPAGEKKHMNFEDAGYGPDFSPLPALMIKRGWEPRFLCESRDMQAEDALTMKKIWHECEEKAK